MSHFLRLLNEPDKAQALASVCMRLREGYKDARIFDVEPGSFKAIPGNPFSYWVSESVRGMFDEFQSFGTNARNAYFGLSTKNDGRFIRLNWEILPENQREEWVPFVKGGAHSPYYADPQLLIDWGEDGKNLKGFAYQRTKEIFGVGSWSRWINNWKNYFRPGLTWSRRTSSGLSLRIMPSSCIFADKGPAAFISNDDPEELLALLALSNSKPFGLLVALQLAAADTAARSYEVGIIQKTPLPEPQTKTQLDLAELARRAWSLKRTLDTVTETSHAFMLPAALRSRLASYDPSAIEVELSGIQTEIDSIAFDLYGFSEEDRQVAQGDVDAVEEVEEDSDNKHQVEDAPSLEALLSWGAGVVFGRFDWRLATGEREASPEPDPFDPLPAKSPGMLPDGAEPHHRHVGILVDDSSHEHDLPRLMADVLEAVDAQVDEDLRRWLRRDFFKYHLQHYSKSRRKAPIYWPLTTASGSYTLWIYYPDLTDQTLFTAVNDFLDGPNGKLTQVEAELVNLRSAGANRSRDDEKRLEELSDFRNELADLRDTLLELAPGYKPNHDDGVQITAAPLWPLFRHKPWQKVLKETWEKLEQGDYDWAHLAMAYWPERVREKCITDKSLAIAHDLEHLYVEPEPVSKKTRGRKKNTGSGA